MLSVVWGEVGEVVLSKDGNLCHKRAQKQGGLVCNGLKNKELKKELVEEIRQIAMRPPFIIYL